MEEFFIDDIEFSEEELNFSLIPPIKKSRVETHLTRQKSIALKEINIEEDSNHSKVKKFNFIRTPNILKNKSTITNRTDNDASNSKFDNERHCKMTEKGGSNDKNIFQTFLCDDGADDDILSNIDLESESKNTPTSSIQHGNRQGIVKQKNRIKDTTITGNVCKTGDGSIYKNNSNTPKRLNYTSCILKENVSSTLPFKPANNLLQTKTTQRNNDDRCITPKSIPISHITPKRKELANSSQNNHRNSKTLRQVRKFPGPAGNLPRLKSFDALKPKSQSQLKDKRPLTPYSPKTPVNMLNLFQENDFSNNSDLWKEMKTYIDTKFKFDSNTIATVLSKACNRELNNCKVKLLYGVIRSFSVLGGAGKMVLKDHSGDIVCAVHKDVLEEHQNILKSGTGMILKDVSVYSPTSKKHYINITPSNIDRFFLTEQSNENLSQTQSDSCCDKQCSENSADTVIDKFFSDDL